MELKFELHCSTFQNLVGTLHATSLLWFTDFSPNRNENRCKASEVKIPQDENISNTTSNVALAEVVEISETSVTEELTLLEKLKKCRNREELVQ